jgi:hypothetical protein
MKEFDLKKLIFPIVLALTAIGFTPACGGNGEVNGDHTDKAPTGPVATAPIETPTSIPTLEPTATPEPAVPSIEEIDALLRQGYEGLVIPPEIINDNDMRDINMVLVFLGNCKDDMQPFTPPGSPITFEPNMPGNRYGAQVLIQCQKVGDATKELYLFSGKDVFLEANQAMKIRHKAMVDKFSTNPGYWSTIEKNVYTIDK